jgi:hypothetical protein
MKLKEKAIRFYISPYLSGMKEETFILYGNDVVSAKLLSNSKTLETKRIPEGIEIKVLKQRLIQ